MYVLYIWLLSMSTCMSTLDVCVHFFCVCESANEKLEDEDPLNIGYILSIVEGLTYQFLFTYLYISLAAREILFSCLLLPINVLLAVYWLCTGSTFGTLLKPIHLLAPWLNYRHETVSYDDEGLLFNFFMHCRDRLYFDYHSHIVYERFPLEEWNYPFILYE